MRQALFPSPCPCLSVCDGFLFQGRCGGILSHSLPFQASCYIWGTCLVWLESHEDVGPLNKG